MEMTFKFLEGFLDGHSFSSDAKDRGVPVLSGAAGVVQVPPPAGENHGDAEDWFKTSGVADGGGAEHAVTCSGGTIASNANVGSGLRLRLGEHVHAVGVQRHALLEHSFVPIKARILHDEDEVLDAVRARIPDEIVASHVLNASLRDGRN
jgi:hypothetical protein